MEVTIKSDVPCQLQATMGNFFSLSDPNLLSHSNTFSRIDSSISCFYDMEHDHQIEINKEIKEDNVLPFRDSNQVDTMSADDQHDSVNLLKG